MNKLFIWTLSDTVVEYGTAIGFAPTKEKAIEAICDGIEYEDLREELREELQKSEPDIATSEIHGYFANSPT
jgi:predicted nucleic acid-binding OB-fold protein